MKTVLTFIALLIGSSLFAQTNWAQKTDLPAAARHHPITFSIDGKGYVVAGFAGPNIFFGDFHEYDPATDTWTTKTNFPGGARGFAYGASYNGKGYIGFGLGSNGMRLNDLWEYDPGTDTWTELTACGCTGRRHPAFLITDNGKLFVGMGDDNSGDRNDWWEYDIATDAWTQKTDLPGSRRHHPYYFSIGTDAYVGFGHTGQVIFNDFYRFNSLSGQWTKMRDFPGEARVAGAQFSYDGYGYIISGEGADHQNLDSGEFFRYDPRLDSWFEQEVHPGPGRWATGTFVIDDDVYLIAGEDDRSVPLNDMWVYDLRRTTVIASTEEAEANTGLKLYPNPANDRVFVSLKNNKGFQLYGIDGKLHAQGELSPNNASIDVSMLSKGIYTLKLNAENEGSESLRLVIQ